MSNGRQSGGVGGGHAAPVYQTNGTSVSVAVWEKQGDYGPMWSFKFQQMKFDQQSNQMKYYDGFNAAALPELLAMVLDALAWIRQRKFQLSRARRGDGRDSGNLTGGGRDSGGGGNAGKDVGNAGGSADAGGNDIPF